MRGITLIETLIYIALFMLLIGSGVISAYYIIDSSEKNKSDVSTAAEAQFLLRKIDWALTGSSINSPLSGIDDELSVNKIDTGTIVIDLLNGRAQLKRGSGSAQPITAERIKIDNLLFEYVPIQGEKPAAIEVSFTANGKLFEMIKYLRK